MTGRVEVSGGTVPVCASCGSEPGKYRRDRVGGGHVYIGEDCKRDSRTAASKADDAAKTFEVEYAGSRS